MEEPLPIVCGEGEELVDGQCQAIPTGDGTDSEPEENGGSEVGGNNGEVEMVMKW